MNWDDISIVDWSRAADPVPFALSASTTGCGCCSDSEIVKTKEGAEFIVRRYISEREEELAQWRGWLTKMESAHAILPL